jgi:methyltransferase family protein
MRATTQCLVCGGNYLRSYQAIFAPFIAKRIWNREPFSVEIKKCRRCKFTFADQRFDAEEENRLYADYRGDAYQSLRQSCEPWYTRKFNARLSTGTMTRRRAPIEEIFRQHLPSGMKAVLDFGGDRGDLFAGIVPGAATYVYDISGIQPAAGVKALSTLDECADYNFDLIGCSNVLEYVAFPRSFLGDIKRIARYRTLVFLEVPSEKPFGLRNYAKRTIQEMILLALRPRLAFSMLPFGFLRQVHEHVNFFSLHSLKRLVEMEGFRVLAGGTYQSEGYSFGPYRLAGGQMAWTLSSLWGSHPTEERS